MRKISIANGNYIDRDGNQKANWVKVGVIGTSANGKEYVLLDPTINLAGFTRDPGKDMLMCTVYDDSNQQGQQPQRQQAPQQGQYAQQQPTQQAPQQQNYQQPNQNPPQQYQQPQTQPGQTGQAPNGAPIIQYDQNGNPVPQG
jgi:hypothetical protein